MWNCIQNYSSKQEWFHEYLLWNVEDSVLGIRKFEVQLQEDSPSKKTQHEATAVYEERRLRQGLSLDSKIEASCSKDYLSVPSESSWQPQNICSMPGVCVCICVCMYVYTFVCSYVSTSLGLISRCQKDYLALFHLAVLNCSNISDVEKKRGEGEKKRNCSCKKTLI